MLGPCRLLREVSVILLPCWSCWPASCCCAWAVSSAVVWAVSMPVPNILSLTRTVARSGCCCGTGVPLMGDVFSKSPYTLCQNTLQSNLSHQAALLGLSEQTGAQGVMQGGSSVMLLFSSVQIIYANSFRFGFKF